MSTALNAHGSCMACGAAKISQIACPECDRVKCEVCGKREVTGRAHKCCGKPIGIYAPGNFWP